MCDAKICLDCGPPFADCYCGQRTYCRRCKCECRNAAARCGICRQKCCVDCCRRRKDMRKGTIACDQCNPRDAGNGDGMEEDEEMGEEEEIQLARYGTDEDSECDVSDDREEGVEVSSMDAQVRVGPPEPPPTASHPAPSTPLDGRAGCCAQQKINVAKKYMRGCGRADRLDVGGKGSEEVRRRDLGSNRIVGGEYIHRYMCSEAKDGGEMERIPELLLHIHMTTHR